MSYASMEHKFSRYLVLLPFSVEYLRGLLAYFASEDAFTQGEELEEMRETWNSGSRAGMNRSGKPRAVLPAFDEDWAKGLLKRSDGSEEGV